MAIPTFVINLPRHERRRRLMEAQLEFFPELRARFVVGIDGREIPETELPNVYDAAKALREWGQPLTRTEIGCALSHLAIYRTMVEEKLPQALVLEDSALLGGLFPEAIAALEDSSEPLRPVVTLLSPVLRYRVNNSVPLTPRHRLAVLKQGARLGVAYVINRRAAHALVEHGQPVCAPADAWERCRRHGWAELRAVVPYCVSLNADGFRHSTTRLATAPDFQGFPSSARKGWYLRWHKFFGLEENVPRTW